MEAHFGLTMLANMWIRTIIGVLLIVVLVVVIAKLLKKQ